MSSKATTILEKPYKICFISPLAFPILANSSHNSAGGAEIQQTIWANELKENGYKVFFIVGDFGQPKITNINNITIVRSFKPYRGNRIIRFISNMISLYRAMRKINADFYIQRSGMSYTGIISFFCRMLKKKFIYSIGHDRGCNPELQSEMNSIIKKLYKYGINKADKIIVQSKAQKYNLKKNYELDSILIKNCHVIPEKAEVKKDNYILWVGSLLSWKQPEIFLKLARELPYFEFKLIGVPKGNGQIYRNIKKESESLNNLEFLGFVPFYLINDYFAKASLLINTSETEGFPNTFIQAWANFMPAISLNVDPDECICNFNLGAHSKNYEKLKSDVIKFMNDKKLREEIGENARKYVEKEHNVKISIKKFYRLLENV